MTERRQYAQRYKKLWKSIANWLKNNSGWKVAGVAKEGSRRRGDFSDQSDIDVDFWISGPYQKQKVYDDIIPKLRNAYNGSQVQKGTSQNVIKFVYDGLEIDLILLPESEFREKVQINKLEVIQNRIIRRSDNDRH